MVVVCACEGMGETEEQGYACTGHPGESKQVLGPSAGAIGRVEDV